jgi:hypothetical protein
MLKSLLSIVVATGGELSPLFLLSLHSSEQLPSPTLSISLLLEGAVRVRVITVGGRGVWELQCL